MVRVAVDGGERVVGVRYPEMLIPEVEKTLKEQMVVERMQRVQAVSERRISSFLLLLVTGFKTPSYLLTYSCSAIPPHPFSFSLQFLSFPGICFFFRGGSILCIVYFVFEFLISLFPFFCCCK